MGNLIYVVILRIAKEINLSEYKIPNIKLHAPIYKFESINLYVGSDKEEAFIRQFKNCATTVGEIDCLILEVWKDGIQIEDWIQQSDGIWHNSEDISEAVF